MIIGTVGLIGSGKGTVSDILVSEYGFIKESFASPLKDAVSLIFGWDRTLLEGDTPESRQWREQPDEFWSEKFGIVFTPRLALQLMGTEAGRNVFHEDIWVHSVLKRMDPNKNYVISDTRFINEIQAIKKAGGIVIHVKRGDYPEWFASAEKFNVAKNFELPEKERVQSLPNYPDIHYSEWAWAGTEFHYVLDNDGSLDALHEKVKTVFADFLK